MPGMASRRSGRTHPFSGVEEAQSQGGVRMVLYDMVVTSLHFKSIYTGELVGDNYAVVRNVVSMGHQTPWKSR